MKITIKSDKVPAAEVAEILTAADKAFERFLRTERSGARASLAVHAVNEGSVEFVLDVNDLVSGLKTAAGVLSPFVSHIAEVIQTLRMGGKVSLPDRRFVKSIVQPVANGHATQVNVVCNGPIIILDRPLATILNPILNPPRLPRMDRGNLGAAPLPLSEDQIRQLEGEGLQGTALLVEGEWYARLVRGGGVLVPIHDFGGQTLEHNRRYTFRGRPERGRFGEIIAISISGAQAH